MVLYEITADYRPKNPKKPKYYVIAETAKEAKEKFKSRITWLQIYNIEQVDDENAREIVKHYEKHIVIR